MLKSPNLVIEFLILYLSKVPHPQLHRKVLNCFVMGLDNILIRAKAT